MEVEAVDEGTLAKIVVPEGTADVPVNQLIAVLAGEGEDVKAAAAERRQAPRRQPQRRSPAAAPPKPAAAAPTAAQPPTGRSADSAARSRQRRVAAQRRRRGNRIFASPLARRLAKEAGIDVGAHRRLRAAWPHHRARRRGGASPARACARRRRAPRGARRCADASRRSMSRPARSARCSSEGSYEVVPHDDMRKIIAQRLTAGEADHPAFLSDARLQHRQAAGGARGDQRGGAEGQGRQARLQALGQRLRHQGAGARAAARARRQRHLDRSRHAQAQAFRRRRRGRDAGRPDHAGRPQGGDESRCRRSPTR